MARPSGVLIQLQFGEGPPKVLAQKGEYAAIACAWPQHAPAVVWESAGRKSHTILAQVLK